MEKSDEWKVTLAYEKAHAHCSGSDNSSARSGPGIEREWDAIRRVRSPCNMCGMCAVCKADVGLESSRRFACSSGLVPRPGLAERTFRVAIFVRPFWMWMFGCGYDDRNVIQ